MDGFDPKIAVQGMLRCQILIPKGVFKAKIDKLHQSARAWAATTI